MRAPVVGIDAASRLRLLADGLRLQGEQVAEHAYMEIWPILNSGQLRRRAPQVRQISADLESTSSLARTSGTASPADALAAVDERFLLMRARVSVISGASACPAQLLAATEIAAADAAEAAEASLRAPSAAPTGAASTAGDIAW